MRKNLVALTLGLLMITVSAAPSFAQVQPPPDPSEWERTFHLGLDHLWFVHESDCKQLHECHEYRGISLVDINISKWTKEWAEDGYDKVGWFFYDNDVLGAHTSWRKCDYDGAGTRLGCEKWDGRWGFGELPMETETVRLILRWGFERNATFDIAPLTSAST